MQSELLNLLTWSTEARCRLGPEWPGWLERLYIDGVPFFAPEHTKGERDVNSHHEDLTLEWSRSTRSLKFFHLFNQPIRTTVCKPKSSFWLTQSYIFTRLFFGPQKEETPLRKPWRAPHWTFLLGFKNSDEGICYSWQTQPWWSGSLDYAVVLHEAHWITTFFLEVLTTFPETWSEDLHCCQSIVNLFRFTNFLPPHIIPQGVGYFSINAGILSNW